MNLSTGNITWKQNIKSIIRPTVIDNLVLTVSSNGFFVVLDKNKGNIIRSTSFKKNLNNLEKKIQVTGFIVAKNNIYLTISNGRILKINILNGGVEDIISTRRLVHIIRAFSIFGNKEKAIQVCINRFDDETKQAFLELYDKVDVDFHLSK